MALPAHWFTRNSGADLVIDLEVRRHWHGCVAECSNNACILVGDGIEHGVEVEVAEFSTFAVPVETGTCWPTRRLAA